MNLSLPELLSAISIYGITPGLIILFLVYLLFYPEKFEKLSSIIWKYLRLVYKGAEKKYITHDIQSRVNDYISSSLSKELVGFSPVKLKVEWVDEDQSEEEFISKGKIVLRMRKSDNQNKNFVNASMVFVAQNLLRKAKCYISARQKESIDLFACKKIFEKEKHEILDQFVQDFLLVKNDDKKIANYFERYDFIDKAGLFFPVFVQEMTFLGEKVFAKKRESAIIKEVNELIEFLLKYSQRKIGEENNSLEFTGSYCRFAIIIIGRSRKIISEGKDPYVNRLKKLADCGAESLYLIGNYKNEQFIHNIIESMTNSKFFMFNSKKYKAVLNYEDGSSRDVKNYLVVLRSKQIKTYYNRQESDRDQGKD